MEPISQSSMSSGEARAAIQSSQEELRTAAVETLRLLDEQTAGEESLRAQGRTLCAAVQAHLQLDERLAAIALADVLGLEGVLLVQLDADRRRQRANVSSTSSVLEAANLSRPRAIAAVRALAESVLVDLAREDRYLMTADVDELANDSPGG